jgi:hypothetical protein
MCLRPTTLPNLPCTQALGIRGGGRMLLADLVTPSTTDASCSGGMVGMYSVLNSTETFQSIADKLAHVTDGLGSENRPTSWQEICCANQLLSQDCTARLSPTDIVSIPCPGQQPTDCPGVLELGPAAEPPAAGPALDPAPGPEPTPAPGPEPVPAPGPDPDRGEGSPLSCQWLGLAAWPAFQARTILYCTCLRGSKGFAVPRPPPRHVVPCLHGGRADQPATSQPAPAD